MTTTCQICARAIKANTGLIAHHGYQRPGQGWQTSSCFGARYRPYEEACDALPKAIERAEAFRDAQRTALATLRNDPPAEFKIPKRQFRSVPVWRLSDENKLIMPRPEGFDGKAKPPGGFRVDSYALEFWTRVNNHAQAISAAERDIAFMQERLAAWKAPVPATEAV